MKSKIFKRLLILFFAFGLVAPIFSSVMQRKGVLIVTDCTALTSDSRGFLSMSVFEEIINTAEREVRDQQEPFTIYLPFAAIVRDEIQKLISVEIFHSIAKVFFRVRPSLLTLHCVLII